MSPRIPVGAGVSFNSESQFRNGDYSGLAVDPSDGSTFWAANEYAGGDLLWNTKIASFRVGLTRDSDWYSVSVAGGSSLTLTANVPAIRQSSDHRADAWLGAWLNEQFQSTQLPARRRNLYGKPA